MNILKAITTVFSGQNQAKERSFGLRPLPLWMQSEPEWVAKEKAEREKLSKEIDQLAHDMAVKAVEILDKN